MLMIKSSERKNMSEEKTNEKSNSSSSVDSKTITTTATTTAKGEDIKNSSKKFSKIFLLAGFCIVLSFVICFALLFSKPIKSETQNNPPPVTIVDETKAPNFLLGLCEGDCDHDKQCEDGLFCFHRGKYEAVPGCSEGDLDPTFTDYCSPLTGVSIGYIPGNLDTTSQGLLLSHGLDVRVLATTGFPVKYLDGTESDIDFHGYPDGGATFVDTRPNNPGGWIYVSNSEIDYEGEGGVGAITFNARGEILEYKQILHNTTRNCGGGVTPWNTWISCEEKDDQTGYAYQVDPTGVRPPEKIILGDEGGVWESFAYDDRDASSTHFYITEDHERGALARFTPNNPDWSDPWNLLLDPTGQKDYLVLVFDTESSGTFYWTPDKEVAMASAEAGYPNSEGIDRRGAELIFTCKKIKKMFTLQLDEGTFTSATTVHGLFDGEPDQVERLIILPQPRQPQQEETYLPRDLLYFTEDGEDYRAGVHARDENGRFFTILESKRSIGETTGLAFSPDGKFLYVAYQEKGTLFCVWRRDGKAFGGDYVDVRYHDKR